jgi:uncharacterized protein YraI
VTRFAARFRRLLLLLLIVLYGAERGRVFAAMTDDSVSPVRQGTVHASDVNIRAGSSLNHESLGKAQPADTVTIRSDAGDWYCIALPAVATCYIHTSFVSIHPHQQEQGTVTTDRVNLRARPTTASSVLGQVREGERVTIRQQVDAEWLAIAPPPSARGWIHKQFVTLISEAAPGSPSVERSAVAPPEEETTPSPVVVEKTPTDTLPSLAEAPAAAALSGITQEHEPESLVGTIEDLGRLVARPARHKLMQDHRVVAFLVSERFDLNRFLHRPVRVWGAPLSPPTRSTPLIRVDRIEPVVQPL